MHRAWSGKHIVTGAGAGVMLALLGSAPAAAQNDEPTNSVAGAILRTYSPSAAQAGKTKRAGGSGELQQLRMQQNLDRQQKDRTIRSNVSKKNEQTKKSTIRKMQ